MSLQDAYKQWCEEDPDFGKVNNANPSAVFAFEIPGNLTVAQVATFTSAEAAQQIKGVDDYDNPVTQVPLAQTSRTISFHFCGRAIKLPIEQDAVPVPLFVHVIARLLVEQVCPHPDRFDLGKTPEKVFALPFYRFYYDSVQNWWDVVFDTFPKAPENA